MATPLFKFIALPSLNVTGIESVCLGSVNCLSTTKYHLASKSEHTLNLASLGNFFWAVKRSRWRKCVQWNLLRHADVIGAPICAPNSIKERLTLRAPFRTLLWVMIRWERRSNWYCILAQLSRKKVRHSYSSRYVNLINKINAIVLRKHRLTSINWFIVILQHAFKQRDILRWHPNWFSLIILYTLNGNTEK